MCCEFDAKMHLDAQSIEQLWYWASAFEFLLIAHAHLTTHGHTNSSTHIWYSECSRSRLTLISWPRPHFSISTHNLCLFFKIHLVFTWKSHKNCEFKYTNIAAIVMLPLVTTRVCFRLVCLVLKILCLTDNIGNYSPIVRTCWPIITEYRENTLIPIHTSHVYYLFRLFSRNNSKCNAGYMLIYFFKLCRHMRYLANIRQPNGIYI